MTGSKHDRYDEDRFSTPFRAADSYNAITEAADVISQSRSLHGGAEDRLVVLGTLAAEIESELTRSTGIARRDGLSFAKIAELTGLPPARVRKLAADALAEEARESAQSAAARGYQDPSASGGGE